MSVVKNVNIPKSFWDSCASDVEKNQNLKDKHVKIASVICAQDVVVETVFTFFLMGKIENQKKKEIRYGIIMSRTREKVLIKEVIQLQMESEEKGKEIRNFSLKACLENNDQINKKAEEINNIRNIIKKTVEKRAKEEKSIRLLHMHGLLFEWM